MDNVIQKTAEETYLSPERQRWVNAAPTILEASFHTEPGFAFLNLKLSDGRRLLIPREDLSELANATTEEAKDISLRAPYFSIWWPQLDDGLYLPDFLERRWGKVAERREVAA